MLCPAISTMRHYSQRDSFSNINIFAEHIYSSATVVEMEIAVVAAAAAAAAAASAAAAAPPVVAAAEQVEAAVVEMSVAAVSDLSKTVIVEGRKGALAADVMSDISQHTQIVSIRFLLHFGVSSSMISSCIHDNVDQRFPTTCYLCSRKPVCLVLDK